MRLAPAGQRDRAPAAAPAAPRGWTAAAAAAAPPTVAAAAMLALGLWGLARHSAMGNDEVVTRWAALLPLHQLAHMLSHVDAVHGLYYLLMHGWMAVGTSPAVMRVPTVIGMVVAVALAAILTRRLTGSGWAGLLAGLIMAFTPSISYYAQTARSYALVMACVLGATLALLHALSAETAGARRASIVRRWLGYGALVVLGGYLNEMFLLVLAAHAITVGLARYGRGAARHWAAAAAGGAVLVAPLLVISVREAGAIGWIPPPHLYDLKILFRDYFGPSVAVGVLAFGCAAVAVLPPRGAWPWRAAGARREPAAEHPAGGQRPPAPVLPWWLTGGVSLPSVAAPLLVVPGFLLLLESAVARPLYVDRYVLYGEAGAAMLAGTGAWRIGRWLAGWARRAGRPAPVGMRALAVAPGVALCLCALLLQLGAQQHTRAPDSRLFNFGGPSRYVAAHARPGDGVLFFSDFFRKAELGYPGDYRKVADFSVAVSPARAGTFDGVDKPLATVTRLMLTYRRIWVVGQPPWAHQAVAADRAQSAVLRSHFTLIGKRHFKNVTVTLWLRR